ncbi:MAG: type III-B CRISPR module RAMP protein Cmr6 [Geminicoccaceae bacterium]|nr:type III-B CRISPR module RAMP protein Cmr6 [Geminicoccaceae bacterium]
MTETRWLPGGTSAAFPNFDAAANLSLVFAKFAGSGKSEHRRKHAREFVEPAIPLDGDAEQRLNNALATMKRLASQFQGVSDPFRTVSALITGIGLPSPLENGIELHPTLGVPYVPGSSIKGMVRNWAEQWADDSTGGATDTTRRIFGTPDHVGSVLFLDALPEPDITIELDIMNVHYQEYYQGTSAPADWLSPNPVLFYVVPAGKRFRFAFLPRDRQVSGDIEIVRNWFEEAAIELGLGAKTKSGYGRLKPA